MWSNLSFNPILMLNNLLIEKMRIGVQVLHFGDCIFPPDGYSPFIDALLGTPPACMSSSLNSMPTAPAFADVDEPERKMKKFLLGTVALIALGASVPAIAADMGARTYNKAPAYAAPIYNWTGFYVGAQLGGLWGNTTATSGPFPGANNQTYDYNTSGFLYGGHVGYNYQATPNFVVGVEGDFEGTSVNDTGTGTLGFTHKTDIKWLGSIRGRLGYTMSQTMIYATGGWAFGEVEITKAVAAGAAPFATYSDTRNGWTLGAGIEHAFTPNWSARAEYRYTDLGSDNMASAALNSQDDSTVKFHAIRAGITYKFGGPIVAKY